MLFKHILRSLFLTIWIYSAAAGFYIVVNAWVHPETLSWQLTHFAPWPREDTFGAFSWLVSFVSFFIWNLLRAPHSSSRQ